MASTNSSAPHTITVDSEPERRPQADPLPSKCGEIGYVVGAHTASTDRTGDVVDDAVTLPARHPADRDPIPAPDAATPDLEAGSPPPASPSHQNEPSITKSSSLLGFLKPKTVPSFGGIQLTTILIFLFQLLIFGGSIVAWIFTARSLTKAASSGTGAATGPSTIVFVHVVFAIALLGQLIFLERRLFRLRGERYSYLHPGEVLPRHRNMGSTPHSAIAFAPWNRPPLPTYAATLAQSGVGTGDVEDHLIAAPPPPAYGNTRGSTLLLAGYLRESLRVQRPQSAHSTRSLATPSTEDRPMSYVSRDEDWEERQDAQRAQRLEDTLSRLEMPPAAATRS